MPLGDRAVLDHVITRVSAAQCIEEVVVATSDKAQDDVVAELCTAHSIVCIRGSETDVLSRYAVAVRQTAAEVVVRVTSDCPLFSPRVLDDMLMAFNPLSTDYLSTNWPQRSFPIGLDCEVMRGDKLLEVSQIATDPYDREHVTAHFYRNPEKFRLSGHHCVPSLAHISVTLDTREDYDHLLLLLRRHPELADPNTDVLPVLENYSHLSSTL